MISPGPRLLKLGVGASASVSAEIISVFFPCCVLFFSALYPFWIGAFFVFCFVRVRVRVRWPLDDDDDGDGDGRKRIGVDCGCGCGCPRAS